MVYTAIAKTGKLIKGNYLKYFGKHYLILSFNKIVEIEIKSLKEYG